MLALTHTSMKPREREERPVEKEDVENERMITLMCIDVKISCCSHSSYIAAAAGLTVQRRKKSFCHISERSAQCGGETQQRSPNDIMGSRNQRKGAKIPPGLHSLLF